MSYMKLIKLLYFADRKALLEHGRPITYDRFVSMDQGPVLSQTYNLIVAENIPSRPSYWRRYISEPENYEVSLVQEAPNGELSAAQEAVLDDVFLEFGLLGRWQVVELAHQLPEWEDPRGSSIPIDIRDVLRGAGVSPEDVKAIEDALASEDALVQLLT